MAELTFDAVARAAHAGAFRITTLDHKATDDTVEDNAVIITFFNERDKVVYSIRRDLRIKLCLDDIAVFHFNSYDRILCHNSILL